MADEMDSMMLKQIAEIEKKDESQVLAELAGEQIEEMIYTVDTYDRRQKKKAHKARLSWAGTRTTPTAFRRDSANASVTP